MASKEAIVASFVESAPPGELANVINDLKVLASSDPSLVQSLQPAFKRHNEEQYATVKVPGSQELTILSSHNALDNGRYFDSAAQKSFEVDHASQQASNVQDHPLESQHAGLVRSLQTAFSVASAEHFPSSSVGVYPAESGSSIALLLVANKYSPQNFWNARWRSTYYLDPSSGSVTGNGKADVHYYEDGNVRMATQKKISLSHVTDNAENIVKEIAKAENKFQEELNRAFATLADGSFKTLRRQLPVTRQRIEWERIGGYRLGQDIGGGRSK